MFVALFSILSRDLVKYHSKYFFVIMAIYDKDLIDFYIILCKIILLIKPEKKLECLNLKGEKIREWQMEYSVRYIKVIGGPVGKEGIVVGLRSGHLSLTDQFVNKPKRAVILLGRLNYKTADCITYHAMSNIKSIFTRHLNI
ncbi:intraflagellar transport 122-like protein [Brachionus plicatilis]|uniref:Intraflagellar transport 122-like protein n=1 Tax=Brachionus plicatilis TaxID=10195 RepID=A0A3M7RMZ3_BRAPC|nr:intraflagellar transport 122-like protein [Brachionus plicatilis]